MIIHLALLAFVWRPQCIHVTAQEKKEGFSEFLISYLHEKYPKILTEIQNEFYLPQELLEDQTTAYKGYVFEMMRKGKYDILLGDAYAQKYVNGSLEPVNSPLTILYKCQNPIRYCSGDPRYCELREGDLETNLIIDVPHGGNLLINRIPDRDAGCYINGKCFYDHRCEDKQFGTVKNFTVCAVEKKVDNYTREIALSVADEIKKITGKRPHVLISNLHRKKLDVNRGIERGTFNILEAEQAWMDFHQLFEHAKMLLPGKRGLIIDMHGNSQHKNWNMLGYGLSPKELSKRIFQPFETTIRSLGDSLNIPFNELITGNNSLAFFMKRNGIEAMPSLEVQHPGNEKYFAGGYIIHRHGSMFGGHIDAIQMEINEEYRQPDKAKIFSEGFAKSLVEFIERNYIQSGSAHYLSTTHSHTISSADNFPLLASFAFQPSLQSSPHSETIIESSSRSETIIESITQSETVETTQLNVQSQGGDSFSTYQGITGSTAITPLPTSGSTATLTSATRMKTDTNSMQTSNVIITSSAVDDTELYKNLAIKATPSAAYDYIQENSLTNNTTRV